MAKKSNGKKKQGEGQAGVVFALLVGSAVMVGVMSLPFLMAEPPKA